MAAGMVPINLISTYATARIVNGPVKVLANLTKGLREIGCPYVINRSLGSTRRIWVHSDLRAVAELPAGSVSLLGPNLVERPEYLPGRGALRDSFYLLPSSWAARSWTYSGYKRCPIRVWPVGIDTEAIVPRDAPEPGAPVLVYFKHRFEFELALVTGLLQAHGLPFTVLRYGDYAEPDFDRALRACSFVLWLGCSETQGIALQEALATNVPILVLDSHRLADNQRIPWRLVHPRVLALESTSAPYFDERCGLVIDDIERLPAALDRMMEGLPRYRPREYILERLSLRGQAQEFVRLFQELEERGGPDRALPKRDVPQGEYTPRLLTRLRVRARTELLRLLHRGESWT